jgi:hypothetical protein
MVDFQDLVIDFGPLWLRKSTSLLALGPVVEDLMQPVELLAFHKNIADLQRLMKEE